DVSTAPLGVVVARRANSPTDRSVVRQGSVPVRKHHSVRVRAVCLHRLLRLAILVIALQSLIPIAPVAAQTVFDQNGFGVNHGSYTVLPYEYIDPLSGNLILVVTDLTLPGNAGLNLSVQRVYNSAVYPHYANNGDKTLDEDSWAGIGWRLHFGR